MKTIFSFVLALVLFTAVKAQAPGEAAQATADVAQKVEWLSWDQMVEKMEKEPRKVMIDVYTDWCGWCKRMDATTMKNPTIVQILNEQYYAVKMDGEHKQDIEFRDRVYKFKPSGRRGYHELPAELMNGKMSYPTLVFLDENFNIIQPLPGYQQPQQLEPILSYFGGDFYKSVAWDKFQTEYKSPN